MFPILRPWLVNPTLTPPDGAAPFNVVLAVRGIPPDRVGVPRLPETNDGHGGLTVTVPEAEAPPALAVTVTGVVLATGVVDAVKVALVCPGATETDPGTATLPLLLASCTVAPPAGAAPDSETVPVTDCPPVTELGLNVSEAGVTLLTAAGVTVTGALSEFALLAVILPEVAVLTGDVVTGNVRFVEP